MVTDSENDAFNRALSEQHLARSPAPLSYYRLDKPVIYPLPDPRHSDPVEFNNLRRRYDDSFCWLIHAAIIYEVNKQVKDIYKQRRIIIIMSSSF